MQFDRVVVVSEQERKHESVRGSTESRRWFFDMPRDFLTEAARAASSFGHRPVKQSIQVFAVGYGD